MAVRYAPDLHALMVPADSLRQHPRNPHNGDIEQIAESILKNGCYRPIYVQTSTWTIIGGHHLWAALLMLGERDVPVVQHDVDDQTALRILLADNQLARIGLEDKGLLLETLRLMQDMADLPGTGFHDHDVIRLLATLEPEPQRERAEFTTLTIRVPVQSREAFMGLTDGETLGARLHDLMRQAGWRGHGSTPD